MKRGLISKLPRVRDLPLLAEVVALQGRISHGGGARALDLLGDTPVRRRRTLDPAALDRLVNQGLRIGAALGYVNSCLTRSVIRCVLLRQCGVDARVAFGLNKHGERLDGHCWVVLPGDTAAHERMAAQFHHVDIYPG